MKKKFMTTLAATTLASGLLAFTTVSSAAPVYDFTDVNEWGALDGEQSKTVNGLTFVAQGSPATITVNAGADAPDPGLTPCIAPRNYACTGDGLGLADDEISYLPGTNFNELLTISGFGGTELTLVSFLDVFIEGSGPYTEVASFIINGNSGTIYDVFADEITSTNGFVEWTGSLTGVNSITFGVNCNAFSENDCSLNDFAVAGVHVVPVPAAVWLFGTGLLGLVSVARRRKVA